VYHHPPHFSTDVHNSRVVIQDLAVIAVEWLKQLAIYVSHLDGNGKVHFKDSAILAENWTAGL
jgi:hypothetical protein